MLSRKRAGIGATPAIGSTPSRAARGQDRREESTMWSVRGSRRFLAGLLLASAATVAMWMGCAVYDRSLLLDAAPIDVVDSSALDAGPGVDTCAHARWPA